MKKLLLAFALMASATAASAQGVELRVGPGADRERTIVRERRPVDEEVVVRHRGDVTGSTCRTVTVREEDDDGNRVTRRIRKCN